MACLTSDRIFWAARSGGGGSLVDARVHAAARAGLRMRQCFKARCSSRSEPLWSC